MELFPTLASMVHELHDSFASIPEERRSKLEGIARFIESSHASNGVARLIFICTHNSRRSHMAQIWAQTAAAVHEVSGVETFSGGTKATWFHPNAVAALHRAGFEIDATSEGQNPVYTVRVGPSAPAMEAFSKSYDSTPNPAQDFCAVMTCSEADADCPVVKGASERVSLPYEDPKESDGTQREAAKYDERCRQIGIEMLYVFSSLRSSGSS